MSAVLVLGGTRFAGRATAAALLRTGHAVSVASRRPDGAPPGAEAVGGERAEALRALTGRPFDLVIDFLAFDGQDAARALAAFPGTAYALVSSIWVPRAAPSSPLRAGLLPVTRAYLDGKRQAEAEVAKARAAGRTATSLRLPVMFGAGDPTGRLAFYVRRLTDGAPLILVDGGRNLAQPAWSADVAAAIAAWAGSVEAFRPATWLGAPDAGLPVSEIVGHLARGLAVEARTAAAAAADLARDLPAYLEEEPLWRERAEAEGADLFAAAAVRPTPHGQWLAALAAGTDPAGDGTGGLRRLELAWLARQGLAA